MMMSKYSKAMNEFKQLRNDDGAIFSGDRSFFSARPHEKARVSRIIFGYLGRQYLLFFLGCAFGFAFLFFIGELLDELRGFLEAGASLGQVASYFLYRQTIHLVHVLPMSLLLAVSYVLNNLARNHEITAVRASGISMVQFCLPVWLISILASFLLFGLHESIAPRHAAIAERIRTEILTGEVAEPESERARLAFRNHRDNRYWFFEDFQRHGEQRGVSVKQFDPGSQSPIWEIRAERSLYDYDHEKWRFFNGYRFDYEGGEVLPDGRRFVEYSADGLDESPRDIFSRLSPAEEMNLREILAFLRSEEGMAPGTRRIFQSLAWYRVFLPLACLMAAMLGVGMSIGKGRAGALRGFASAMGLMVLYYVTSQSFLVLGKYGILPPPVAGALPTFGFTLYGGWLVHRRR